ncbi:alkaline phosphatase D family protein [Marinobacter sp. TBZ242]|uniref:Alkaline phosphatase D family protein n=1 Tax=Marinobacter azerbaijanicus TaxID=3050455 RepID=A0ABT7IB58_9GAMM|nr:alkaline phosphatase D family protein [Marinobacter sp. TBZ242]MDL0431022.1 alkaline phosphatase D family protein [Marinobacter sp. TBZ242]
MKRLSRRDFLKASAMGMGAVVISTGLAGCVLDSKDKREISFSQGVASGDPLQDGVVLWTRAVPNDRSGRDVDIAWEVATDSGFRDLTHSGRTRTSASHDYTLKVDVRGLMPGQRYYYRFRTARNSSPVGVTRTLPEGSVSQVTLAVVSCSNYPAGYFNVYREIAALDDVDALVHLGDYIYEYSSDPGSYGAAEAESMGRTFPGNNNLELISLEDYRRRYAIYRSDDNLRELHRKVPFIVVWDDHEVANDTWKNGAENHDDGEGDFNDRKLDALRAYFEWMPIRPVTQGNEETIFRSFRFGDLVDLHMLDTRIIGRDKQLAYTDYLTQDGIDEARFAADVGDSNRTMLGAEQRLWLETALAGSTATWQVLGQQVLMGRMTLPAELLAGIINPDPEVLLPLFAELANLKGRYLAGDPTLSETEIARVETVLPYNLDAWDGYYVEREVILETARQLQKNLVVLAGDTHNAWASNLRTASGDQVGVEFATAGVSSPGLEDYLQLPEAAVPDAEAAIRILVDDLEYLNVNQRGYMLVTFTPEEVRADWRFVSTVKDRDYEVVSARNAARKMFPGDGNRSLVEVT